MLRQENKTLKENDIRPEKIFNKLLNFSKKDIKIFKNKKTWKNISCIACGKKTEKFFKKNSFSYMECKKCFTFYVSPRPPKKYFDEFYKSSRTAAFFEVFYKKTEKVRKKKLWSEKAKHIIKLANLRKMKKYFFIDIGGGNGTFADEIKKYKNIKTVIIEPSDFLAKQAVKKGYVTIKKVLEKVSKKNLDIYKNKIFTSFELVEHLHDPKKFFKKVYDLMKKKETFIFTTLSGTGVDLVALKQKSKSIFPPHHINFFNPYSIRILLKKLGFKEVSVITPGKLDVDILKKNVNYINNDMILKMLYCTNLSEVDLQQKIADLNISSHMMISCKK